MSEFKISCPNCDQHIAYDESYYGLQVSCPTCSMPIKIPVPAASTGHQPSGTLPGSVTVPGGLRIARPERVPTEAREPQPMHFPQAPMHKPLRPRGKSWLTTFLFAWFLGNLGVDRFYNGRIALGIGKLLTNGVCGLWSLIDVVLLLFKKYRDAEGNYLQPAKRNDFIIALSVVATSILVGIIVVASMVHNIKSEFANAAREISARSDSPDASEQSGLQMQSKVGAAGKGASSPAEAFAGFQRAVKAKDYRAAFTYLTPESQTAVLAAPIVAIAMQKKLTRAFNQGATRKPPGGATVQREVEAKEMKVAAVLKKHGVSLETGEFSESMIAKVQNKGQCYQELAEAIAGDSENSLSLEESVSGNLTGLKINKDTASGRVNGEALKFKRVGNTWYLDLADEG
jgi:TM2 domain-containing membrane protein YozV